MPKYSDVSSEVLHIAQDLIHLHHPLLAHCNIGFVFRSEASTSGGKTVLATTSKVTDMIKPLLTQDLDILIVIAEDEYSNLSFAQRQALIDHQLCHITGTKSGWGTRAHDVEEFQEILDRYGLWKSDLFMMRTTFARAVQLELTIDKVEQAAKGAVISIDAEQLNQVSADLDSQKGE